MATKVPWRTFLPTEHGSWGFVLEPIVLGLLVAPVLPALAGSVACLLLFLAHRPIAMGFSDLFRGKRYPRTFPGVLVGSTSALVALVLIGAVWLPATVRLGRTTSDLAPAIGLYVLALGTYAIFSETKTLRDLPRKLAGAVGAAPTATLIALASPSISIGTAYALTAFVLLRSVPSLIYVRERLVLCKGRDPNRDLTMGLNIAAIVGAFALCAAIPFGWLAVAPSLLLAVRAYAGMLNRNNPVPVRSVGLQELAWGVVTVLLVAFAVWSA